MAFRRNIEKNVKTLQRLSESAFSRVAVGALALAVFMCAGCGSVKTDIALDAPVRAHWRVLVLPLDDSAGSHRAMENSICGATGTQGSSTVAALSVSRAFASRPAFEMVSPTALREELERARFTLPQAAFLDSRQACNIARGVQADMVIRGSVPVYENAWFLFVPCAKVSLALEGYDPSDNRKLWSAEISGRKIFASEKRLVFDLASEAAGQVHARLALPDPPVH